MRVLFFLFLFSCSITLFAQSPVPVAQTTADAATTLKAADLLLVLRLYSISFDGAFTEIKGETKEIFKDGTETFNVIKLEKNLQRNHQLMRPVGKSLSYIAFFDAAATQALIAAITSKLQEGSAYKSESIPTKENEITYYLKENDKRICSLIYTVSSGKSVLLFYAGN